MSRALHPAEFIAMLPFPFRCHRGLLATAFLASLVPAAGGAVPPGSSALQLATSCQPDWIPTFGGMPGVNESVYAMVTFDDGTGPALYAGGGFQYAGGYSGSGLAKWNGERWVNCVPNQGVYGVRALTVFDDGSGPALFVGGSFNSSPASSLYDRVMKWDGSTGSSLGVGIGTAGQRVNDLAVFDDGTGPALYAGGDFTTAGGAPALYIAKWNGSVWSTLPGALDGAVEDLFVYDDGTGAALYVGGAFTNAGTTAVNHVAKWNGTTWSALGAGIPGTTTRTLAAFDDGTGTKLYAGGQYTPSNGIACWNGVSWSTPGGGTNGIIHALEVFDDGTGPALYAAGTMTLAGGNSAKGLARWNGVTWSDVSGSTDHQAYALAVFDDGSGPALAVAGDFRKAGSVEVMRVARWNGSWEAMGSGAYWHTHGMAVYDDGTGPALWVTGYSLTDGVPGNRRPWIGKWGGNAWSKMPVQITGPFQGGAYVGYVSALLTYDDGSGTALYAAGGFDSIDSVPANRVARWNGVQWSAVGTNTMSQLASDIRSFDAGTGDNLYVSFYAGGGVHRWNGTSWANIGGTTGDVIAMRVFDDGSGESLYAAGTFTTIQGVGASNIARWNGTSWSALGTGLSGTCYALAVYDDGSGPRLYAGGAFTTAGGVTANYIAKWNGTTWSALALEPSSAILELEGFDVGNGPKLFAAGAFTTAGTTPVSGIAAWDGSTWSALGGGIPPSVRSMFGYDLGQGPSLVVGGAFYLAWDSNDSFIARWACPNVPPAIAFCSGDGSGTACPCGNNGVAGHGCANAAFPFGAELTASGVPGASIATDTLVLTATEIPGPGLFFQGTGTFAGGAGIAFGDGLLCAGGTITRMGVAFPTGTAASYPGGSTPSPIHLAGATAAGDVRHYQCWYRDAAAYCAAQTFNLTQGLTVVWTP